MSKKWKDAGSWSDQEWALWFKEAYREVLSLAGENLSAEGEYWVKDALEVFNGLSAGTKSLLTGEKAILDRWRLWIAGDH